MCIIVDANAAHEMASSPVHVDGRPVLRWLVSRRGKLALGGRLSVELERTPLRGLLVELARFGGTQVYRAETLKWAETQLRNEDLCKSNDLHVIALAIVSGARLLYSRDRRLQADFRSSRVVNNPRGHVYSSADHEHLLREAPECR